GINIWISDYASNRVFGIDSLLLSAGVFFSIVNTLAAFIVLKKGSLFNFICGICIGYFALFLAFKIADQRWFENYDAYNIMTVIFGNALISVLLWEILLQVVYKKDKNVG
ncbi:hypothetical protein HUK80_17650, partial [Flavobacterium sp. MAH-1]